MLDFNLNYTAFFNCFVNTQSVIPYMYSYKGFQEFFMKIDLPEFPETDGEYEIKIPVKKVRINSEVEAYNIGFVIIAKAQ